LIWLNPIFAEIVFGELCGNFDTFKKNLVELAQPNFQKKIESSELNPNYFGKNRGELVQPHFKKII